MSRQAGHSGNRGATLIRESDLKLCQLCGWLNLGTNAECFVCGWRGHFEQSSDVIHAAVEMTIRRYGRIELQHITDPRNYHAPAAPTLRNRLLVFWARLHALLRR